LVREVCKEIGYDSDDKGLDHQKMQVLNKIEKQSPEINRSVGDAKEDRTKEEEITEYLEKLGAGDQGLMFG